MTQTSTESPRPTEPAFLFATLVAGRRSGDKMLESLAKGWLAELGITVRFARESPVLMPFMPPLQCGGRHV